MTRYRIVRRRTEAAFTEVYNQWASQIGKLAWNQRVPGWDREDVTAELEYSLWVAFQTFDGAKGIDFGAYFYAIYKKRRAMQIRSFNRQKRAAEEVPFSHDELIAMSPIVYPSNVWIDKHVVDDEEQELAPVVWAMLSLGYLPSEVKVSLHLSNRRYYNIIESLQTESVYDWLFLPHQ
jgi:DNA-directed RNA polymerase specialized sigma24 family protein